MRVVMTSQGRTLEQMLLLATGVLRPDLLAVDALDGEALYISNGRVRSQYWKDGKITQDTLKYGKFHLIVFLGTKLDKRRVHFLVDGATHRIIDNSSTRKKQKIRVYNR